MISWVYIFVAHINAWIKRFGKPAMVERFRETGNCPGNNFDPFAVAVIRDGEIISHVPKLISTDFSSVSAPGASHKYGRRD